MKLGIVIIGHGSGAERPMANDEIYQVTAMVQRRFADALVETAIMDRKAGLQTIADAVIKLVTQGSQQIIVAPMFLTNGVHVQKDIPAEIEAMRRMHPNVDIRLASHIGADYRIADILVDRIKQTQQDK